MRPYEMARKCPALADLMGGVLQGQIAGFCGAVNQAVVCMQKLRTLSKRVRSVSTDKRTRSHALGSEDHSPSKTKKARCLQAAPTEASLPA